MRVKRSFWAFLVILLGLAGLITYIFKVTGTFQGAPKLETFQEHAGESQIRLLTDDDYWPYSYLDADGNLTGHDIELTNALANRLGIGIEIIPMEWNAALEAAARGEADGVLTCEYGDAEATEYNMIMTTPYETGEFVAFGREHISKVHELAGTRIGLMSNGNVNEVVETMGLQPWCQGYETNRAAFDALVADECDYVLVRYVIGIGILNDIGKAANGIKPILPITRSNFCIGVVETEPELAEMISQAVLEMKMDGTVDFLSDKWLTTYVEPMSLSDVLQSQPWIAISIIVLILLALGTGLLQFLYRQRKEKSYREQLEKALDLAAQASSAKTRFLFNMSHDIRTPMNAIIGYTAMAEDRMSDPEQLKDYLGKIKLAGRQLLSLINQVLEVSRIESGKIVLESESMDIAARSRTVASISGVDITAKGIDCIVNIAEMAHPRVLGDSSRIGQILINILGNAIKYTPEGGKIEYLARELPSDREGYGLYEFVVADTGIGMGQDFLEHVFDEFARESTSTTSGIRGTGLGMSIVKKLVDMMDGTIEVASEKGKGTTVTVRLPLPLDTAPQTEDVDLSHAVASLEGVKVLLVEDNEMNQEIACYVLESMGAKVSVANDGDAAIQAVVDSCPGDIDIILMDIQMPHMNGYDATRSIRSLPDTSLADIPIVAMTANAFKEDRDEAMKAGMNGHIAKPFDIDSLRETLVNLTQK